jgi:hypothetical protein
MAATLGGHPLGDNVVRDRFLSWISSWILGSPWLCAMMLGSITRSFRPHVRAEHRLILRCAWPEHAPFGKVMGNRDCKQFPVKDD